jgi:hypothetical protein
MVFSYGLKCDLALQCTRVEVHHADKSKLGLSIPYGIDLSPQLDVVGVIGGQVLV